MNKKKNFNLAIVGLGNIGLNLYKHLIKNKKSIVEKNNVNFDIKYVSAKNVTTFLISKSANYALTLVETILHYVLLKIYVMLWRLKTHNNTEDFITF